MLVKVYRWCKSWFCTSSEGVLTRRVDEFIRAQGELTVECQQGIVFVELVMGRRVYRGVGLSPEVATLTALCQMR